MLFSPSHSFSPSLSLSRGREKERGAEYGRILRAEVTVKTNGGSCLGMLSRYEDGNEIIR